MDSKAIAKDIAVRVRQAETQTGSGDIGTSAAGLPEDFCGIWPKAKPVLEFLAGIAILIPGAGSTAGAVLQGLVKVGDQISSEVCK